MAPQSADRPLGIRFSLRTLWIAISLLGVSLAVVHSHREWIGALCNGVFLVLQCVAIVGAICERGERRVLWLAFFVFGAGFNWCLFRRERDSFYSRMSYFILAPTTSEYSPVGPAYLTDLMFDLTEFRPKPGDEVSARWSNQTYYPATLKAIDENGRFYVAWTDGTAPSWVGPQQLETFNIQGRISAQSVLAILFGFLGACLCRSILRHREEKEIAKEKRDEVSAQKREAET